MFSCRVTGIPEEYQPNLSSHVKRGEEGSNGQQDINREVELERFRQYFILGEESSQGGNTSQRYCAHQEHPESYRHSFTQPAHQAHIARVEYFLIMMIPMIKVMMPPFYAQDD